MSKGGEGGKGCRHKQLEGGVPGTSGVREVSVTCDSDGVAEADDSLIFPEVLRPAPGESIGASLIVPHVGKVLQGAPVGKDVEEAQELPVNPPRGRHDTRQKGVCGALPVGIVTINRASY